MFIYIENRVEQEKSFRKRQYVQTYKKIFHLFPFHDYQINYYEI